MVIIDNYCFSKPHQEAQEPIQTNNSQFSILHFQFEKVTQDEKWNIKYNEVITFIETNHRNPSRHRIEEHDMLNWVKANRKLMNAGEMKLERVEKFKKLMESAEKYRRLNQYKYNTEEESKK